MGLVSKKVWVGLCVVVLLSIAAGPKQSEVPPEAFFADYFSGRVLLDGAAPFPGVRFFACVRSCDDFESVRIRLDDTGGFSLLEVNPADPYLRGDPIHFYLGNAHGRILADEGAVFRGVYAMVHLELNFSGPLPYPPAPASLPDVGDPFIHLLPILAVVLGILLVVGGIVLLRVQQR